MGKMIIKDKILQTESLQISEQKQQPNFPDSQPQDESKHIENKIKFELKLDSLRKNQDQEELKDEIKEINDVMTYNNLQNKQLTLQISQLNLNSIKIKEGLKTTRTESSGPLQTSNQQQTSKNSQGALIIDDFSSVDLDQENNSKIQNSSNLQKYIVIQEKQNGDPEVSKSGKLKKVIHLMTDYESSENLSNKIYDYNSTENNSNNEQNYDRSNHLLQQTQFIQSNLE